MCNFFSFLSDAKGNYYYADAELRKKFPGENHDSHSWLANHFLKNGAEDALNAYEFNPFTKVLVKDKINTEDDSGSAEKWANEINWKRICPQLIVKDIIHPFKLKKRKPTKKDVDDLKKWASVWVTVRDTVRASVRASVRDTVGDSVWASIWASVRDTVGDSVWASIWAYFSSFFDVNYRHDFSSLNRLWNKGLVPSFDGKTWRLHSGEKAEIVWEGTF